MKYQVTVVYKETFTIINESDSTKKIRGLKSLARNIMTDAIIEGQVIPEVEIIKIAEEGDKEMGMQENDEWLYEERYHLTDDDDEEEILNEN